MRPLGLNARARTRNRGKTPGKQVQHTPAYGTVVAEIRHFSTGKAGMNRVRSVFTRGFAPVTRTLDNRLIFMADSARAYKNIDDHPGNAGKKAEALRICSAATIVAV